MCRISKLVGIPRRSWVAAAHAALEPSYAVVQATCGYGCGLNSAAFIGAYLAEEAVLGGGWPDACDHFRNALLEAIGRVRPGDVVATVTAAYKFPLAGHFDGAFLAGVEAMVHDRGATLLILGDGPYLKDHGFNCAAPETSADCDTPLDDAVSPLAREAAAFYDARAAAAPGRTLHFPVVDLLCEGGLCRAAVPGTATVAVTDKGHWTTAASLYLAPFLHCFLLDAGLVDADPPDAC